MQFILEDNNQRKKEDNEYFFDENIYESIRKNYLINKNKISDGKNIINVREIDFPKIIKEFEGKFELKQAEIANLKLAVNKLSKENEEIENLKLAVNKLSKENEEKEKLKLTIDKLSEENKEKEKLKLTIDKLSKENEEKIEELNNQISKIKRDNSIEIESWKKIVSNDKDKIGELKKIISENDNKISNLESKIESILEKKKEGTEINVDNEYTTKIENNKKEIKKLTNDLNSVNDRLSKAQQHIIYLDKSNADKDNIIIDINRENIKIKNELETEKNIVNKYNICLSENENLNKKLRECEEKLNRCGSELSNKDKEIKDIVNKYNICSSENENLNKKLREHEEELNRYGSELSNKDKEIKDIVNKYNICLSENNKQFQKYKEKEKEENEEKEKLINQLKIYNAKNNNLEENLKQIENEKNSTIKKIEENFNKSIKDKEEKLQNCLNQQDKDIEKIRNLEIQIANLRNAKQEVIKKEENKIIEKVNLKDLKQFGNYIIRCANPKYAGDLIKFSIDLFNKSGNKISVKKLTLNITNTDKKTIIYNNYSGENINIYPQSNVLVINGLIETNEGEEIEITHELDNILYQRFYCFIKYVKVMKNIYNILCNTGAFSPQQFFNVTNPENANIMFMPAVSRNKIHFDEKSETVKYFKSICEETPVIILQGTQLFSLKDDGGTNEELKKSFLNKKIPSIVKNNEKRVPFEKKAEKNSDNAIIYDEIFWLNVNKEDNIYTHFYSEKDLEEIKIYGIPTDNYNNQTEILGLINYIKSLKLNVPELSSKLKKIENNNCNTYSCISPVKIPTENIFTSEKMPLNIYNEYNKPLILPKTQKIINYCFEVEINLNRKNTINDLINSTCFLDIVFRETDDIMSADVVFTINHAINNKMHIIDSLKKILTYKKKNPKILIILILGADFTHYNNKVPNILFTIDKKYETTDGEVYLVEKYENKYENKYDPNSNMIYYNEVFAFNVIHSSRFLYGADSFNTKNIELFCKYFNEMPKKINKKEENINTQQKKKVDSLDVFYNYINNNPPVKQQNINNNPPVKQQNINNNPPVKQQNINNNPPVKQQNIINNPPVKQQNIINNPPVKQQNIINNPPVKQQNIINDPFIKINISKYNFYLYDFIKVNVSFDNFNDKDEYILDIIGCCPENYIINKNNIENNIASLDIFINKITKSITFNLGKNEGNYIFSKTVEVNVENKYRIYRFLEKSGSMPNLIDILCETGYFIKEQFETNLYDSNSRAGNQDLCIIKSINSTKSHWVEVGESAHYIDKNLNVPIIVLKGHRISKLYKNDYTATGFANKIKNNPILVSINKISLLKYFVTKNEYNSNLEKYKNYNGEDEFEGKKYKINKPPIIFEELFWFVTDDDTNIINSDLILNDEIKDMIDVNYNKDQLKKLVLFLKYKVSTVLSGNSSISNNIICPINMLENISIKVIEKSIIDKRNNILTKFNNIRDFIVKNINKYSTPKNNIKVNGIDIKQDINLFNFKDILYKTFNRKYDFIENKNNLCLYFTTIPLKDSYGKPIKSDEFWLSILKSGIINYGIITYVIFGISNEDLDMNHIDNISDLDINSNVFKGYDVKNKLLSKIYKIEFLEIDDFDKSIKLNKNNKEILQKIINDLDNLNIKYTSTELKLNLDLNKEKIYNIKVDVYNKDLLSLLLFINYLKIPKIKFISDNNQNYNFRIWYVATDAKSHTANGAEYAMQDKSLPVIFIRYVRDNKDSRMGLLTGILRKDIFYNDKKIDHVYPISFLLSRGKYTPEAVNSSEFNKLEILRFYALLSDLAVNNETKYDPNKDIFKYAEKSEFYSKLNDYYKQNPIIIDDYIKNYFTKGEIN